MSPGAALQVMVVANPADIGCRSLWAASLRGAYVIEVSVMLCGKGAAVKYMPQCKVRRKVWISKELERKRPAVAQIIRHVLASARDCGEAVGWRLIASEVRPHMLFAAAWAVT